MAGGGGGERTVFYDVFDINASKHTVNENSNVLLIYLEAVFLLIATNKASLGRCEAAYSDCIF